MPLRISIITPSYQQQAYLRECMASVHDQGYPQLEHIVVDGGSNDGSREVIERSAHRLAWWCSEPDQGQSHAINKGLAHATGSVFAWLNSDDLLLPGALETVATAFDTDPDLVVFQGRRVLLHADGTTAGSPLNDPADAASLFIAPVVNQQSTFFSMAAVRTVGGLDEALHYCMDLDLWWRVLFAFGTERMKLVPAELAIFRLQPESKTSTGNSGFVLETAALLRAMAVATAQKDLVELLDTGHPHMPALRPSNAGPQHAALVRRMVFRYILKWNASIVDGRRFAMLKRMHALAPAHIELPEADLVARWNAMRSGLSAPNWTLYRIGRKLGLWPA
ncbi:MAG: glycosyltransferase [Flavobacteriales bacterium]|nr:glycosyltransferase [Flavobacteriales bacterium]